MRSARPRAPSQPKGSLALGLLALTSLGLATGAALHLSGAPEAGNLAWMAAGAAGAAYALWSLLVALGRRRLGVDVIALLALIGALAIGEYLASAVISLMLASGRTLEDWAAGRARRDLKALLARAPNVAHRYHGEALETVDVEQVTPGDLLLVAPGELVPVDGTLVTPGVLDESALSGEPLPVDRRRGEPVRSGVLNAGDPIDLRATTTAADSTYSGIVRLVSEAQASPAPFVALADRYALWFVGLSLLAAGAAWAAGGAGRAVAVLVVATPCPLILAAPVAFVSGLSRAARRGIVIKGGGVLERLARCTTLLLDKTGTLTRGRPTLAAVIPSGSTSIEELLALAGSLEQVSPHVVANAVVQAALARGCQLTLPQGVHEEPGLGVRGTVRGRPVAVGQGRWVGLSGTPRWAKAAGRRARLDGALTVFVGIDHRPAGVLILEDPLRTDAPRTMRSLRRGGVRRIVMVTGDRPEVAETVGAVIGVDEVVAERSPAEKLQVVERERRRAPTIMVGDGINDAPALALADVGVAMGARGSSASSEAADVVLTVDHLDRVGEATALARRTRRIALQSVVAGMGMSLAAMVAAAMGLLPPVWGALLQEGVDVAVILNALRVLAGGPAQPHLTPRDALLTQRFQGEHLAIRADLDRLRAVADALGTSEPSEAVTEVRRVHRLLVDEVAPHEAAEQAVLYPALERVLGGSDPTGPMSRAHVEIAHQIRRLGQLLDDIGPEGPDDEDLTEMRRILYGLYAVLQLHTEQEEESYLSLGEHSDDGVSGVRSS